MTFRVIALVVGLSLPVLACGGSSSISSGDTVTSAATSSPTTAPPTTATPTTATPTSGGGPVSTDVDSGAAGPVAFVLASVCLAPGAATTVAVRNAGDTTAMVSSGAYLMQNGQAVYLVLGTAERGATYEIVPGATTTAPPFANEIPAGATIAIQFHAPSVTGEYTLEGFGAANTLAVSVTSNCALPTSD